MTLFENILISGRPSYVEIMLGGGVEPNHCISDVPVKRILDTDRQHRE